MLSSRLYIISISISRARNKSRHYVDIAPSGILPGSISSTIHENDLKNGEKELDEKANIEQRSNIFGYRQLSYVVDMAFSYSCSTTL